MQNKTLYQNVERIFRLIRLLQRLRSVRELERLLGTSQRQVYRYLKILQQLHYPVRKQGTRYFLDVPNRPADVTLPDQHRILMRDHASKTRLLEIAIEERRVVHLLNYHSPQDGILPERPVEPLYLNADQTRLQCFCRTEQKQRQYKVSRITQLELTDETFTYTDSPQPMDAFGLSGPESYDVELLLTKRAYHLLWEEFPAARVDLTPTGNEYRYTARVQSWLGVGRFILGLPGEVTVVEPEGLRAYLRGRVERFEFLA